MATPTNPLLGWGGSTGVNNIGGQLPTPGGLPQPTNPGTLSPTPYPGGTQGPGNPLAAGNVFSAKNQEANTNFENILTAQLKNMLIPQFANQMEGYAQPAGNFFNQLMNLGSPFYQQEQQASFQQGVQQSNNAGAQARQQQNAAGYGYGPSGAQAAMFGGMAQAESQNLSTNYLQNLFNNQQMQMQGAQGLSQLAALFNPSNLFSNATNVAQPQTATQQLTSILSSIGSLFGGLGSGGSSSGGEG